MIDLLRIGKWHVGEAYPKIISFYTDDWLYPVHARRLRNECRQLGLRSYIKRKQTTGDYIKNTAMKPFFIKACLDKFKAPVLWVDVDGSLLKPPALLAGPINADFAACSYFNKKLDRDWAVGILWFNTTAASHALLDRWCELSVDMTDEGAFDLAWKELSANTIAYRLPETYHFVKWSLSLDVPEDTVFVNHLSKSEDKMRRKQKQIEIVDD